MRRRRQEHYEEFRRREGAYQAGHPEQRNAAARRRRAEDPRKARAAEAKYRAMHSEKIRERARLNRAQDPENTRANGRKHAAANRASGNATRYMRRWLAIPANRLSSMVTDAKQRAKERGLPFEPALRAHLRANPPSLCACCWVALDYSTNNGFNAGRSPSLDRFENSKGYTVANVRVLCYRCNSLKSNGTIADFEAILRYMRGHEPSPQ